MNLSSSIAARTSLRPQVAAIAAISALLCSGAAQAATINGTAIDSTSITGGVLQSITTGGTTHDTLISPSAVVDNKAAPDVIHLASPAPADLALTIGSLDVTAGSLNDPFEVQFGGQLTGTSMIFLLVNENDNTPQDLATIYPIDGAGNRLGGVSGTLDFASILLPNLVGSTAYNRTTGGSANGTLNRNVVGVVFTLTELGIDGQIGTTGIEFDTTTLDPQEIGLATTIPEPSSLTLMGLGLAALCFVGLRAKRRFLRLQRSAQCP